MPHPDMRNQGVGGSGTGLRSQGREVAGPLEPLPPGAAHLTTWPPQFP